MDHQPVDWHDLVENHPFGADQAMRLKLIERGVYFFPTPTKQASISAAHTEEDIEFTLGALRTALESVAPQLARA
jgi:glutamate-1-semialdehyde 2,1-aminomutase